MSRLTRTCAWVEDKDGKEFQLIPIRYTKDSEGNQVLIVKNEETPWTKLHMIPLIVSEKFKGEPTDVQVVTRTQNLGKFKADELSFGDIADFTGYFFFISLRPSLLQQAWQKAITGFKSFRHFLDKIRSSIGTQRYDVIVKYFWILWETVITVLSFCSVITSGWATKAIICFYAVLMTFQIGSERNSAERSVEKEKQKCAAEIEKYKQEKNDATEQNRLKLSQSLLNLSIWEHHAAHGGKLCVFDMITSNSDKDRSIKLVQYLKKCADELEQQLSDYYHKTVSASFKLVVSETQLRTCTRGNNNLASRKIIGEPPPERTRTIQNNTAYKHIFIDQHSCFNSGDLSRYNSEHPDSKFRCERKRWRKFFLSTIVIPIRWHVPDDESYKVIGVICVDCQTPIADWDTRDSFGYHTVAFYADLLFMSVKEFDNRMNANSRNSKNT